MERNEIADTFYLKIHNLQVHFGTAANRQMEVGSRLMYCIATQAEFDETNVMWSYARLNYLTSKPMMQVRTK